MLICVRTHNHGNIIFFQVSFRGFAYKVQDLLEVLAHGVRIKKGLPNSGSFLF